eukprot:TRINITY_DN842_c0_g1_i1.p1 TRINITY_DN842_c0_g1~~TRINITY_DN842_c0_g1_i1.p1  ORF type:complete len:350 (+),score=81.99 TRINITY_DN842_c0_g1_i1:45-1094(+)
MEQQTNPRRPFLDDFEPHKLSTASFHRKSPLAVENSPFVYRMNILQKFEDRFPDKYSFAYLFIAAFLLFANALLARCLSALPAVEIMSLRSLFVIGFIYLYVKYFDPNVVINDKKNKRALILASLAGSAAAFLYLSAVTRLTLSEALAVMLAYPIITPLYAWFFVDEPLQRHNFVSMGLLALGLLLIWRYSEPTPRYDEEGNLIEEGRSQLVPLLYALLQGVCVSVSSFLLKTRGLAVNPITLIIHTAIISFLLSALLNVVTSFIMPNAMQLFGLFVMAGCYIFGQILISKTVYEKNIDSFHVNAIAYSQVLYAFIADYLLFHDPLHIVEIIAIVIIAASSTYLMRETR